MRGWSQAGGFFNTPNGFVVRGKFCASWDDWYNSVDPEPQPQEVTATTGTVNDNDGDGVHNINVGRAEDLPGFRDFIRAEALRVYQIRGI